MIELKNVLKNLNKTKAIMETVFIVYGLINIMLLIAIVDDAEKFCEYTNNKEKYETIPKELVVSGCIAIIVYLWMIFGLLTSQWLFFVIYNVYGIINSILKRNKRKKPQRFVFGLLCDILFVIFIVVNIKWVHFDLLQFINGLLY